MFQGVFLIRSGGVGRSGSVFNGALRIGTVLHLSLAFFKALVRVPGSNCKACMFGGAGNRTPPERSVTLSEMYRALSKLILRKA